MTFGLDRKCARHDICYDSHHTQGCIRCSTDYKTGKSAILSLKEGDSVFAPHADIFVKVPFDGVFAFTPVGVFVEANVNGSKSYEPAFIQGRLLLVERRRRGKDFDEWLNEGDRIMAIGATYDPAYPNYTVLVHGPSGPDGWRMVQVNQTHRPAPLAGMTDDELDRITEEIKPVCTCGFFPDDNCPIDHMGRNKPDPPTPGGDS